MAISYGQKLEQSRYQDGGRTYVERGDGGFGEWMDNPGSWDLMGLDFGAPPVAGAKPMIGTQYGSEGVFEGWTGPNGEFYTPFTPEMYNNMARVYQENGIPLDRIGRMGNFMVTTPQEGINHLSRKGMLSKYAAMAAGGAILGGAAAYGGLLGSGAQAAVGGGTLAGEGAGAAGAGGLLELGGGGAGFTGSVAPIGGATATTALPGSTGLWGTLSTMGEGINWGELAAKYGPSIAKLAPSAIQAITGAINAGQGEQAVDDILAREIGAAGEYRAAGMDYAQGVRDLWSQNQGMFGYKPGNVTTGVGSTRIDPATGQVTYDLSQPYQTARDQAFKASEGMFGQIGSFDPRAHATERYNAAQGLLAEGDAQRQSGLMQDLYNKGGFGLTLNQGAAATPLPGGGVAPGTGTVGVNPYVDTFLNATNRRNAQMSYDSLREGEGYLDNLIKRQQGMFGFGAGIDKMGAGLLDTAQGWGRDFTSASRDQGLNNMIYGDQALRSERDAVQGYISKVLGAQNEAQSADVAARQQQGSIWGDVAKNVDWGSIIKGIWG